MPQDETQAQDATREAQDADRDAGQAAEATQAQDAGSADASKTFDEAYVRTLRGENAKTRTELKSALLRLKELEDAQLSDAEKREKRLKDLEAENADLRRTAREAQTRAAAASAGAVNPAAVARLIDEGEDVEKAVTALKKSDPYLFHRPGAGSADGGAGGAAVRGQNFNDLIRRAAGRS
jgi:myosin heavy subunit